MKTVLEYQPYVTTIQIKGDELYLGKGSVKFVDEAFKYVDGDEQGDKIGAPVSSFTVDINDLPEGCFDLQKIHDYYVSVKEGTNE